MKIILCLLAASVFIILCLSFMLKWFIQRASILEEKATRYEKYSLQLEETIARMKRQMESERKIKNEESEKINALYSGDSVANAINGLSKHKKK